MKTTGNSSPLAACSVIRVTAPESSSQRSIAEARVISARKSWIDAPACILVEFAGGRDQLVEVRQAVLAIVARCRPSGARDSRSGSRAAGSTSSAGRSRSAASSSINRANSSSPRPALSLIAATDLASPGHRQQRNPSLPRRRGQMLDRRLAQSAGRDIDHPREGHVVLGIDHQVQVGQNVLDLLPLVKRDASHDLIGYPRGPECLLDRPRQGGHPAENRDVGEAVFALLNQSS